MSERDLLIELGAAISGGYGAPVDTEQVARTGATFLEKSLPKIREVVCRSGIAKSFANEGDTYNFAAAVGDLMLTSFTKVPSVAATLGVLSAKMGLKALCPSLTD